MPKKGNAPLRLDERLPKQPSKSKDMPLWLAEKLLKLPPQRNDLPTKRIVAPPKRKNAPPKRKNAPPKRNVAPPKRNVQSKKPQHARGKKKQEADALERQRLGIFGEQDLRDIVNAADHNTVRFEKYYKGRTFSGVGAFKQAGKANLGFGTERALHINVGNGEIVCFIDKSKADVVADWGARTRVRFTGTISTTALLGGTLQLTDCTVAAG